MLLFFTVEYVSYRKWSRLHLYFIYGEVNMNFIILSSIKKTFLRCIFISTYQLTLKVILTSVRLCTYSGLKLMKNYLAFGENYSCYYSRRCFLLKMECVTFMLHLLGDKNDINYIIIYKENIFALHFYQYILTYFKSGYNIVSFMYIFAL